MKIGHFNFVILLALDWNRFHRRKKIQALGKKIAASGGKVLLLNRPVSPFITLWHEPKKWRAWLEMKDKATEILPNMFLYTPYYLIHELFAFHFPILAPFNKRLISIQVSKIKKDVGFDARQTVLWLYHPYQLGQLGVADEAISVYECYDEYSESIDYNFYTKSIINALEKKLLGQVDIVFTTSQSLYHAKKRFNPQTHLNFNAADVQFFAKTQDRKLAIAPLMQALPHPIIGYLGTIHEYTDIDLLNYVAQSRPDWSIVMIGPEQQKAFSNSQIFQNFRSMPNVFLLGWLKYEDLPSYLKAFDVCLIPYRTEAKFNEFVNPNKLHEYTAMGKPIVSTPLPTLQTHKEIIRIAGTPENFVFAIEKSLKEDSYAKIQERVAIAKKHSWDQRADSILQVINDYGS